MGDSTSHPNGTRNRQETYAHGYDSALTLQMHAARTAGNQAGWFTPYLKPGMTLLDCGCATGSITVGLAEFLAPGQVTGVDISEVEIERARARASEMGITNVRFEVGNVYQLDFPSNSFDAIFSHNVLEHLNEPERAVREMHRVLKPDGVIGIRNTDVGGTLLYPSNDPLAQFVAIYEADWKATNGHPRLGRRLVGLLNEVGFVDVVGSASYETYADPEPRRFVAQIPINRVSEADFVSRVIENGLATQDELGAMKQAWLDWQELPDAFLAIAHGEAVGRKA